MRKFTALNAVALTFSAISLFAVGEARLTGKVIDTSGKPIPNATITVTATEGKTFKEVFKTEKDGTFAIFLLDGTIHYDFLVGADGFNSVRENKKLNLVPAHNKYRHSPSRRCRGRCRSCPRRPQSPIRQSRPSTRESISSTTERCRKPSPNSRWPST